MGPQNTVELFQPTGSSMITR